MLKLWETGWGTYENSLYYLKLFQNLKAYFKKQRTTVICNNMNEPQKYLAESKKASGNVH